MCAMVSGLVSGRTLHDFARGLHMQRYLALGLDAQWSAKHLLGWADGILADCFEALLGALFLDRGHSAARNFMLRAIEVRVTAKLCVSASPMAVLFVRALILVWTPETGRPEALWPLYCPDQLALQKYVASLRHLLCQNPNVVHLCRSLWSWSDCPTTGTTRASWATSWPSARWAARATAAGSGLCQMGWRRST